MNVRQALSRITNAIIAPVDQLEFLEVEEQNLIDEIEDRVKVEELRSRIMAAGSIGCGEDL